MIVRVGVSISRSEKSRHHVGSDLEHWQELTKRFPDLAPETRAVFLRQLDALAKSNGDDNLRAELQLSLRQLIHHYRRFSNANWAMPEELLGELEVAYHALTPSSPVKKIAWMFESYSIPTLQPAPRHDYKAEEEAAHQLRRDAVRKVLDDDGQQGVLTLLEAVKAPARFSGARRTVKCTETRALVHRKLVLRIPILDTCGTNASSAARQGLSVLTVDSVFQPSILRITIWPDASKAQNSIAAVSADGSTVCVLIRRLNSSCRRSMAFDPIT